MGISPPTFEFNEYFTAYLKYQIAENAKPCNKTNLHILKNSCLYQIHVAF